MIGAARYFQADWWVNLSVWLSSVGVLGLARWLTPDPLGGGTHTQLGLPPCTFHVLTGRPCPMCGATTAFSYFAHGQPLEALYVQPFASVLFVCTLGVAAVASVEMVFPRGRWKKIGEAIAPWERWIGLAILVGLAAGWAWTLSTQA